MYAEERKCTGNPEKSDSESRKHSDIASKFRAYRLTMESTKARLKEAETLIEELRNEINFSRKTEKNLRSQISSAQYRLICLQETLKKFINISDQQNQNEKASQKIQERLKEFEGNINQIREKLQKLLQFTTREMHLIKKIKEFDSLLEAKNTECDLMKMEIQTLTKEKKNMEIEFWGKFKNLENCLESLKKKERETEDHYREGLLYYKQQVENYEQKLERYEKERKSFLEDFELPNPSEVTSNKITSMDGTVSILTEKRSPKIPNSEKRSKTQEESNELDAQIHCSQFIGKPKFSNFKKSKNCSKTSNKQKPQLEFLIQDSSPIVNLEVTGRKRRLFSTNRNHYND